MPWIAFGLDGMPYSPATGLYQTATVALDPSNDQRLGRDRSGFGSGTTNLYAYALNNTVQYVDPSGECTGTLGYSLGDVFTTGPIGYVLGALSAAFNNVPNPTPQASAGLFSGSPLVIPQGTPDPFVSGNDNAMGSGSSGYGSYGTDLNTAHGDGAYAFTPASATSAAVQPSGPSVNATNVLSSLWNGVTSTASVAWATAGGFFSALGPTFSSGQAWDSARGP